MKKILIFFFLLLNFTLLNNILNLYDYNSPFIPVNNKNYVDVSSDDTRNIEKFIKEIAITESISTYKLTGEGFGIKYYSSDICDFIKEVSKKCSVPDMKISTAIWNYEVLDISEFIARESTIRLYYEDSSIKNVMDDKSIEDGVTLVHGDNLSNLIEIYSVISKDILYSIILLIVICFYITYLFLSKTSKLSTIMKIEGFTDIKIMSNIFSKIFFSSAILSIIFSIAISLLKYTFFSTILLKLMLLNLAIFTLIVFTIIILNYLFVVPIKFSAKLKGMDTNKIVSYGIIVIKIFIITFLFSTLTQSRLLYNSYQEMKPIENFMNNNKDLYNTVFLSNSLNEKEDIEIFDLYAEEFYNVVRESENVESLLLYPYSYTEEKLPCPTECMIYTTYNYFDYVELYDLKGQKIAKESFINYERTYIIPEGFNIENLDNYYKNNDNTQVIIYKSGQKTPYFTTRDEYSLNTETTDMPIIVEPNFYKPNTSTILGAVSSGWLYIKGDISEIGKLVNMSSTSENIKIRSVYDHYTQSIAGVINNQKTSIITTYVLIIMSILMMIQFFIIDFSYKSKIITLSKVEGFSLIKIYRSAIIKILLSSLAIGYLTISNHRYPFVLCELLLFICMTIILEIIVIIIMDKVYVNKKIIKIMKGGIWQ